MNHLIIKISAAFLIISFTALGAQAAKAKDICAGVQYNSNLEAQQQCPAVCDKAAPEFNGNWTNAYPNVEKAGCKAGEESVCGSSIGDICAGRAYMDNNQAQQDCPSVVEKAGKFNGNWTNNPQNVEVAGCKAGYESVCGCG